MRMVNFYLFQKKSPFWKIWSLRRFGNKLFKCSWERMLLIFLLLIYLYILLAELFILKVYRQSAIDQKPKRAKKINSVLLQV